jgi:hypothetical protein
VVFIKFQRYYVKISIFISNFAFHGRQLYPQISSYFGGRIAFRCTQIARNSSLTIRRVSLIGGSVISCVPSSENEYLRVNFPPCRKSIFRKRDIFSFPLCTVLLTVTDSQFTIQYQTMIFFFLIKIRPRFRVANG